MKNLLLSSLLLNLVLGGSAGYLWLGHADRKQVDFPVVPREPAATSAATAAPLSWSQIESDSPLLYMDHLHAIGCPEATIRRILNLDHASSVTPSTAPVVSSNSGSPARVGAIQSSNQFQGSYPSTNSGSSYSLAAAPASGMASAGPQNAVASAQYAPQPKPVVPLAFQEVSLPGVASFNGGGSPTVADAASPLNMAQQAAVAAVQEEFGNELSGTSLNPNDPVYADQWAAAQQRADDMMRARLGDTAFMQYQLNAVKQAAGRGK